MSSGRECTCLCETPCFGSGPAVKDQDGEPALTLPEARRMINAQLGMHHHCLMGMVEQIWATGPGNTTILQSPRRVQKDSLPLKRLCVWPEGRRIFKLSYIDGAILSSLHLGTSA